jgi:hypothetical protein
MEDRKIGRWEDEENYKPNAIHAPMHPCNHAISFSLTSFSQLPNFPLFPSFTLYPLAAGGKKIPAIV